MRVTFPQNLIQSEDGLKKANIFSLPTPKKRESCTIFGAYAPQKDAFFWKSSNRGNAKEFKMFLHQLRAHSKNKKLLVVLDNASLHHSKYISKFEKKYPSVKLLFLPTYSPEYNPVEQVWKWAKPLVHAAKTINGGLKELLGRFRKLMYARTHNMLASSLKVGIGIWKSIYR